MYIEEKDSSSQFISAGVSDLASRAPLDAHLAYRVGSTTKTFTAVVVLQLAAEGRIALSDRVSDWVDGYKLPNRDSLTLEHLLRMRSGLFDFEDDPRLAGNLDAHLRPYGLEEVIAIALAHEPYFLPGRQFNYSNTNYCLLEMVVANVTGNSLEAALRERMFLLGMASTWYPTADDLTLPEPFLRGYHWSREGWRECSRVFFGRGDGALISTASDQARFFRALIRGDLVPDPMLERMMSVHQDDPPADEPCGMGLLIPELGTEVLYGHSGSGYGYINEPYVEIKSGRFAVCAMNGTFFGFPEHRDVRFSERLRAAIYARRDLAGHIVRGGVAGRPQVAKRVGDLSCRRGRGGRRSRPRAVQLMRSR